ncbi:TonB-dependent receptor domain-containing protein [Amorphus coralli]|uniref:TonB-dependent receptor domain-containing protein n=1 Tax=Amorphus coralli TaxID=340680 RepID=UPI00035DFD16|nr:TonB-dependent receptor [Amorphus coralli]
MSDRSTGSGRTRRLPARALGATLAAATLAATATALPLTAQAQAERSTLAISPGPLSTALNQLAAQTGLQIVADSQLVDGVTTSGLTGAYTSEEALNALTSGTSLRYTFTGPRTVRLASALPGDAATTASADSGEFIALEPITIAGEKLPRDVFRTYASVGVATAQELSDFNDTTFDQAVSRMANVTATQTASGNNSFSIRGLNAEGVTQPSRSAPVISVMVDGAMQGVEATRRGSRGVWDVEQIEVLRGPQSTLQGRNSLGGTVIVETKDPTWTPEAIVDGQIGNLDYLNGAFAVSTPIVQDQVAIRIAGQAFRKSADIDYTQADLASLGDDEFEEIRGKILIEPDAIPELSALFTVSRTHDKPSWNAVSGPDYFDRVYSDPTNTAAEFRDTYVNRYIAELGYDFTPSLSLKSITAFNDANVSINSPTGSSFDRSDTRDEHDLSQDIQLAYDNPGVPVSGVVGFFAGKFQTDLNSSIDTNAFASYGIPSASIQKLDATNETSSFAAYADLRYEVLDRVTLLGGGRILQDTVSSDYTGTALDLDQTQLNILQCFFLGCVPEPAYGPLDEDTSVTNTVFLPKIGIAFDLTEDQILGFTASRGYRAGFAEAVPGSTTINEVDPEFLWSYEVAYRSRWAEDKVAFNANAFYYDYENQQILTYNPNFPGQTITENSARSHAYGAEFEVRYRPFASLELFSTLGLLKTEFDEGITTAGNLEGKEFPESPAVTAAIGGVWRHHSGFFAAADVTYTDGYYSAADLDNSPDQFVDAHTLVNAQIGYETRYAMVSLFARNLLDEDYLTSISETGNEATIGEGRFFGLRVSARY